MGEFIHYTVTWGDTLASIASRFKIDKNILMHLNQIESIYVGLILIIPQEEITSDVASITSVDPTLYDYLKRHQKKKHLFNFYHYQKVIEQNSHNPNEKV